jgi:excisionase family DNA binding protein
MIVIDGVEMVDVREASRLVGRTPETVRRWVWTGRVEAIKQGNRLLVPRDQIVGAIEAGPEQPRAGSLREWAAGLGTGGRGRRGATASDLVMADREARS